MLGSGRPGWGSVVFIGLVMAGCGGGAAQPTTVHVQPGHSSGDDLASLEQRCRGENDAPSCTAAGRRYDLGVGTRRNVTRAQELYALACEWGEGLACVHLLEAHVGIPLGTIDPTRSFQLALGTCERGNQDACAGVGFAFDEGVGVSEDSEVARQHFERSCEQGSARGCTGLAGLYIDGRGVDTDLPRALELYTRACDGGDAWGCTELAILYDRGEGVTRDYARAAQLNQQACDGGDPLACGNLGSLYEDGSGVAQSFERARGLYERACAAGDMAGCNNLGALYGRGDGVEQDLDRARDLYQEACEGGEQYGCDNLDSLLRDLGEGESDGSAEQDFDQQEDI